MPLRKRNCISELTSLLKMMGNTSGIRCNFAKNIFQIAQTNIETQVYFSFSKYHKIIIMSFKKSQRHLTNDVLSFIPWNWYSTRSICQRQFHREVGIYKMQHRCTQWLKKCIFTRLSYHQKERKKGTLMIIKWKSTIWHKFKLLSYSTLSQFIFPMWL